MVSKAHVDALVELALAGPSDRRHGGPGWAWNPFVYYTGLHQDRPERHQVTWLEADECGRMLAAANALSVRTLYLNADGMVPEWADGERYCHTGIHFTPYRRPTAVEGLYLIQRFEYQACEARGWHRSQAAAFCDTLRRVLIRFLPGFDQCHDWTGREVMDGVTAAVRQVEWANKETAG
jgi:hypothetical protein